MTDPDYRQMEELEQKRLERTLAALTRVALGVSNYTDAFFLAAELGVTNLWPRDLKALAEAEYYKVDVPSTDISGGDLKVHSTSDGTIRVESFNLEFGHLLNRRASSAKRGKK